MKIIVNPDNLVHTEMIQTFYKVRVILENDEEQIAISNEGGKYIFPGGKCEKGETALEAITREVQEETGILLNKSSFHKILEIETLYKDFYDYRTKSFKPRFTNTIYYYAKCSEAINVDNMRLTVGEIKENFKIAFVSKEQLKTLLSEDHSSAVNGKYFDEENKIILNNCSIFNCKTDTK